MFEFGRRSATDFTRDRVLTFTRISVFIINLAKKSLQLEIYDFTRWLSLPDITKQAFSKARKKLLPGAFKLINQKFLIEFYSENTIKTYKGYRIMAVDGSTLRLPINPGLYKEFDSEWQKKNNGPALARTSIMFDVLNGMTLKASIDKYTTSERAMAYAHLESLLEDDRELISPCFTNDILMFDRGYESLFLMFYILHVKKHFITRVTTNFVTEIREFINSGNKDGIISINPFASNREVNPNFKKHLSNVEKKSIQVRVLVFNLTSGEKEVIITSLIDDKEFTYENIFELYGLRWGVEEEYKYYKIITEMENFSGKSKLAIEQDFYATVFACNMNSVVMLEAQAELEEERKDLKYKYNYKINKNLLVGIIKNEIIDVFLSDCDLEAYSTKLKERIKKNIIPIRPGRSFPRIFKKTNTKIRRRAI